MRHFLVMGACLVAACGKGEGVKNEPGIGESASGPRLGGFEAFLASADLEAGTRVRTMSADDLRWYMEAHATFLGTLGLGQTTLGDATPGGQSRRRARLGGSGLGDQCLGEALAMVPVRATASVLRADGEVEVGACFGRVLRAAGMEPLGVVDHVRVAYLLECREEDLRVFDGQSLGQLVGDEHLPCQGAVAGAATGQLERTTRISVRQATDAGEEVVTVGMRTLRMEGAGVDGAGSVRVRVSRDVVTEARSVSAAGATLVHADEGLEAYLRVERSEGGELEVVLNDWRGTVSPVAGRAAPIWTMSNGQTVLDAP